jgi:flagellar motility protein MotE (MotC chaperone)
MNENKNEDNINNKELLIKKELNNSEINETDFIMNQLELLTFTEDKSFDDPTILQKSRTNIKNGNKELINNLYLNIQKENESKSNNYINIESIEYNGDYNNKKDILKLKIDNIITSLRLLEIKVNNKYYISILKFKNYLKDENLLTNYFEHFNDLFNLIIELIFIIKKEIEKTDINNIKNQKNGIILKLEKEINNKDKQIEGLLNKLKVEQQKTQKNSKDNNNELVVLQKENKELYYQLGLYKNYIKKIDNNNIALEEQLNNIILEKISKRPESVKNKFLANINKQTINMNNNININNINGIYNSNSGHIIFNESNKDINFINYKKINKDETSMQFRKLNLSLINLLKEINKILCVYDITLNKANIEDSQTNVITNLSNMIESSLLINNDKMNKFHKSFLGNMDKILNKIDNIIKLSKNNILIKKKENINFQRCSSPIIKQKSAKEINNYTTTFTPKSSEKINSNKIIVHRKNLTNIKSNY